MCEPRGCADPGTIYYANFSFVTTGLTTAAAGYRAFAAIIYNVLRELLGACCYFAASWLVN